MKKIILLVLVFVTVNKWSNAQCNKKILWTSTKEEFLDANGQVTHTDEDSVTLEVSDSGITINHNNIPQDELKGTIKEINCNWSEPFKTGKTTFKSDLTEVSGDEHNGNQHHGYMFHTKKAYLPLKNCCAEIVQEVTHHRTNTIQPYADH